MNQARLACVLIGALLLPGGLAAQGIPGATAEGKGPPVMSSPEQDRGLALLKDYEVRARGIKDPMTRAFYIWQIGEAYAPSDGKRSASLLRDAFMETLSITSKGESTSQRGKLQGRILEALLGVDRSQASSLAVQADATARHDVLAAEIESEKDDSRIMQLIREAGRHPKFPYDAVVHLMIAYPDMRQAIFESARASSLLEDTASNFGEFEDLATLIVRFRSSLPRNELPTAIDQVLDKAKKDARVYCIGAGRGARNARTLTFNNAYEFRLFELLPVLDEVDSQRANSLKKQEASVISQLSRYPKGLESFTANNIGVDGPLLDSIFVAEDRRRVTEILESRKTLSEALDKVSKRQSLAPLKALPMSLRSDALLLVAGSSIGWGGPHPSIDAVHELIALLPDLPPLEIAQSLQAAEIAALWKDNRATEKILEIGAVAAGKLLKQDLKERDPSEDFRGFWPSTRVYVALACYGGRHSLSWADKMLQQVPDPDIRDLVTLAYARVLLGQEADLGRNWSQY